VQSRRNENGPAVVEPHGGGAPDPARNGPGRASSAGPAPSRGPGAGLDDDLLVAVVAPDELRGRVGARLEADGATIVAAVATVDALAAACGAQTPHVTVVAWDDQGNAAVRRVLRRMPRTRVVAIVSDRRSSDIRAALRAGADGVVQRARIELRLPAVVKVVSLGQAAVPRERRMDLREYGLSRREREVIALAAQGLRNADIAAELSLASSTVKRHLSSAYRKVGVRSREELPPVLGADASDGGSP
jgi:DNA-binding NarL/FixJ family response regulator